MNAAIEVRGLGKRYRLGARQQQRGLREVVSEAAALPFRQARAWLKQGTASRDRQDQPFIWALSDVSFSVMPGEVVGIIGRNGAGKSTLLKILARITKPTSGAADVYGRVGSLLEVGTGFHPELTGRENIMLNGAILGMRRAEILRKFDEIVDFAEIDRFIDTPVKHYSSGMYVRLAFAVAAHLEPEILFVDEVLAVGDAAFQKKCLGKMGEVSHAGRTILFVSHSMDAIRRLCRRVLWLDGGRLRALGATAECIGQYLQSNVVEGGQIDFGAPHQLANAMPLQLHAIRLTRADGQVATRYSARESIRVEIEWSTDVSLYKPRIGFVLQTADGQDVLTALDANAWAGEWLAPGRRVSTCELPGQLLNEGAYVIDIGADGNPGQANSYDFTHGRTGALLRFEVEDDLTLPNKHYGEEGFRDARWPGVLLLPLPWQQAAMPRASQETSDVSIGSR